MSGRRDIIHERDEQLLKEASRRLISAAGGTDGAGETVGARQQRMSDCQNPNTADFLRIDEVRKLQAVTVGLPGWPHVTRGLAKADGFALVQLPVSGAPETVWSGYVARLAKEMGDLVSGVCTDLADDNDVSPMEAGRRLKDAAELVAIAVEFENALKARAEGLF